MLGSSAFQLDLRRATLFKGTRIVAGYGAATLFALGLAHVYKPHQDGPLLALAANTALWASVSESGRSRQHGAGLLLALCPAFVLGAGMCSQFCIGQMLAWSLGVRTSQFDVLLLASVAAATAMLLCRAALSEFISPDAPVASEPPAPDTFTAIEMGMQAGIGAALVDVRRTRRVWTALGYLLRPPGWRPDGLGDTTEDLRRRFNAALAAPQSKL